MLEELFRMKTVAIFGGAGLYLLFIIMNLISLFSGAGFAFAPFIVILAQIGFAVPIFLYLRESADLGNYALSLILVTALLAIVFSFGSSSLRNNPTDGIDNDLHEIKVEKGELKKLLIDQTDAGSTEDDDRKKQQKEKKEIDDDISKTQKKEFDAREKQLNADKAVVTFNSDQRRQALTGMPLNSAGAIVGLFIVFLGAPRKES